MIPNDFNDLDRDVLSAMGIDPISFEMTMREDEKDSLSQMYVSMPNDRLRFVLAWVFDLGHTKKSCAEILGVSRNTMWRYATKIKQIFHHSPGR